MPKTTNGKAPGKILWLGGYSILERPNVGFVTTVDAYAHASVKLESGSEIKIDVPQFAKSVAGKLDANTGELSITVPEELSIVKTALEISTKYAAGLGARLGGISLTTRTDDAMSYKIGKDGRVTKSGLGSSAAVTVATIGAALNAFGVDANEDEALHKLAQLSHSIATGKVGSGFDVASVTCGSIIYSRYSPEIVSAFPKDYGGIDLVNAVKKKWDYSIEQVRLPTFFRLLAASIVGGAAITTSFVKKVNELKAKNPDKYFDVINRLNAENVAAINALKKINKEEDLGDNMQKFKSAFENGWAITKELGVLSGAEIVDSDVNALIEESKHNGAYVAKTPGAGGRDAIVALAKDQQSYNALKKAWSAKSELETLDISACNTGFELG